MAAFEQTLLALKIYSARNVYANSVCLNAANSVFNPKDRKLISPKRFKLTVFNLFIIYTIVYCVECQFVTYNDKCLAAFHYSLEYSISIVRVTYAIDFEHSQ